MVIDPLRPHQKLALNKMHNGCILAGGVGTGKSRTALHYYRKVGDHKPLLIITTAKKRDSCEWLEELLACGIPHDLVTVDSWNNIGKYDTMSGGMVILDEQRLVGYGAWSKSFLKLAKANQWIVLSGTPGDTWSDYMTIFIANGFYRNKTDFADQHMVMSNYGGFPRLERYLAEQKLERYRQQVLVFMPYERSTVRHNIAVKCSFDDAKTKDVMKTRWDPYKDEPIQNAGVLCYVLRRVANESEDRLDKLSDVLAQRGRVIVFYNFDYERDALLGRFGSVEGLEVGELNGHKHTPVPASDRWLHLVQYSAGAEAWNCISTNTIVLYSQTYSWRTREQAMGRIDRLNTPYTDLYYYHFRSSSKIDMQIYRALSTKKDFNARAFGAKF